MAEILEELTKSYFKSKVEQLEESCVFDVQNWVDLLGDESFETVFLDLSIIEVESILQHKHVKTEPCPILSENYEENENSVSIRGLIGRIDVLMSETSWKNYFVRLGSRSPKDAIFRAALYGLNLDCQERFNRKLERYLRKIHIEKSDKLAPKDTIRNKEYCSFVKSSMCSLAVENGHEAMDLLLHSERIHHDLSHQLEFYDKFLVKLVIRKWCPKLHYRNEFRCFIYNSRLNAISQNNNLCFFPKLQTQKEYYESVIKHYFDNTVRVMLKGFSNYVLDIGILDNGLPIVIELNMFSPKTSACLFDWTKDIEILVNGPLEMRINEEVPENHQMELWNSFELPGLQLLDAMRKSIILEKKRADLSRKSWFSAAFFEKLRFLIHKK